MVFLPSHGLPSGGRFHARYNACEGRCNVAIDRFASINLFHPDDADVRRIAGAFVNALSDEAMAMMSAFLEGIRPYTEYMAAIEFERRYARQRARKQRRVRAR